MSKQKTTPVQQAQAIALLRLSARMIAEFVCVPNSDPEAGETIYTKGGDLVAAIRRLLIRVDPTGPEAEPVTAKGGSFRRAVAKSIESFKEPTLLAAIVDTLDDRAWTRARISEELHEADCRSFTDAELQASLVRLVGRGTLVRELAGGVVLYRRSVANVDNLTTSEVRVLAFLNDVQAQNKPSIAPNMENVKASLELLRRGLVVKRKTGKVSKLKITPEGKAALQAWEPKP